MKKPCEQFQLQYSPALRTNVAAPEATSSLPSVHCMQFSAAAGSRAVLLLLHHGWKHAHEDPATSVAQRESCPEVCYFQASDVCNFRTCNHEMWILLFFSLSLLFYVLSLYSLL